MVLHFLHRVHRKGSVEQPFLRCMDFLVTLWEKVEFPMPLNHAVEVGLYKVGARGCVTLSVYKHGSSFSFFLQQMWVISSSFSSFLLSLP